MAAALFALVLLVGVVGCAKKAPTSADGVRTGEANPDPDGGSKTEDATE